MADSALTLEKMKLIAKQICNDVTLLCQSDIAKELHLPLKGILEQNTQLLKIIEVALSSGNESTPADPQKGELSATPVSNSAGKILVIDDCENTQNLLRFSLKKSGFEVISRTNPKEALTDLESMTPDLILLDLMMPEMSGFEVISEIRSNPKFNSILILVGSSRSYDKDRLEVLEKGANDFVAKPYNIKELALRIKNLLGRIQLGNAI